VEKDGDEEDDKISGDEKRLWALRLIYRGAHKTEEQNIDFRNTIIKTNSS
jgi:hypothetical protein